jgi:HEAT repeat protein
VSTVATGIRSTLFVFLLLGLLAPPSAACSCASLDPPLVRLARTDAVFSGTVIDRIDPRPKDSKIISTGDPIEYTIEIDQVWKGDVGDIASVISARAGASCGYTFKIGETYLIYARLHDGKFHTGLCSRTRSISRAGEDLAELSTLSLAGPPRSVDSLVIVTTLKELLSGDPTMRRKAARALQKIGKRPDLIVPKLDELFEVGSVDDRVAVIRALRSIKIDPLVYPLTRKALEDDSTSVRAAAVSLISGMRSSQEERISLLVRAMHDPAPEVRRAATYSSYFAVRPGHSETFPVSEDAVWHLTGLLLDENDEVRIAAAEAMYNTERGDTTALPYVLAAAEDPSPKVRIGALKLLSCYGSDTPAVLAALLRGLADPHERVRHTAAYRIGRLGPEVPEEAVHLLCEVLQDTSERVRTETVHTLGKLLPKESARSILMDVLVHSDMELRREALSALVGPKAIPDIALPALRTALNDPHYRVRLGAVAELRFFTAKHPEALDLLLLALLDQHQYVRQDAAHYVGRLGPAAAKATPLLGRLLSDPYEDVRRNAKHALWMINDREAVSKDDNDRQRQR